MTTIIDTNVGYTGGNRINVSRAIVPGVSITLAGEVPAGHRYVKQADGRMGVNAEPMPYSRTFKVGDEAEYDSYNLSYTGRIVSITAKTVTIREDNGTSHRLTIDKFDFRNWDFDAAETARRNAEEMQCL